ncbi:MAG: hypothetical protein AMXMBFR79_16160 [Chitinophagaceae bacterium]
MFWRKGEPKVILFSLAFFWLTITIKIFYADFTNQHYEDLSISFKIVETTYVALISLLVFALGIYVTSRNAIKKVYVSYTDNLGYSVDKVIVFYIIMTIVATFLKGILFVFPAFSQLFNAIVTIKLGLLFLLIHTIYTQKKRMIVLIVIIAVEVILSLVSFFSSFKNILITVIITLTFYPIKASVKQYLFYGLLLFGFIYMTLIWQSIKGEYRFFLNQGTRTQSIQVSSEDALNKIWELSAEAKPFNSSSDETYQTIDRISYIEFFSQTMVRVPTEIPYENGALWLNNIMHILLPRILNPNKKAIDDSEMVNKYAIRKVAGAGEGSSWSLGFLAESYIDFGKYFMYIPVFLLGALMGWVYKILIVKSINFIWGFSMVSSLWVYMSCNGYAGTKILGWLLMYLITFFLFKIFLMKPIDRFLRGEVAFRK